MDDGTDGTWLSGVRREYMVVLLLHSLFCAIRECFKDVRVYLRLRLARLNVVSEFCGSLLSASILFC